MRVLVVFTIHLIAFSVCAQSAKNVSLTEALSSYEESLDITFSYDAELLSIVDEKLLFEASDFNSFKQQLETNLPLKMVQIDDKYYTISSVETVYSLSVADSIDDTPILQEVGVQVLVNRAPIETIFENGKWVFNYKPDAASIVEVYSDGYVLSAISLGDLMNKKHLRVSLDLRTKYLNTVVIEDYITKGINLSPSEQHIKINVGDLPLLPGETDGDIFASIAALPGITIPDGRAGNLFIRGSETDQSLILFDNIPVYHRGHYYGTISPYNPKVVKNVEVYRSGFHPRLGDRVGGAIVINSDQPNETEDSQFGIGANTLFGTAYGKASLVMPRLLVNYDATKWMTLKGSTGLYNQYLSQVKNLEFGGGGFDNGLWSLADDESGFVISGTQSTLGAVMNFDQWVVDIEAFNKTANNITVYEERIINPNSIYFTMDQQTQGIDLLLKREISSEASVWMGYSYHNSKITLDTTDQVTYLSKYVQPHVWYVGGSYSKNRWKLSAGWKYSSGLNAKSLDIIYARVIYERMAARNPEMPPPNPFLGLENRYPNVYQLDTSASYSIPKSHERKWNASIGLSLINVLDQENLTDRAFRGQDGFVDRAAIGFAPNLMLLVEW
ncbi:hypothetical protein B484DRAFT_426406 [Ochromonadaceae sp. CCMP2298]|nr:hypothetical protein B484DRAFT_426406 [Ochromonadaceae sp. CCMP2298]